VDRDTVNRLIAREDAWGRAMVANDADAIGRFMADDWVIVGPDGSLCNKARFLELVRSGALTHDVMDAEDFEVRVHGDTAIVTARGISGGQFQGHAFRVVERVTDVWVRQGDEWRCVHTHLSRIASEETAPPGSQTPSN
jgi:ketosteroid isomerase-like protein